MLRLIPISRTFPQLLRDMSVHYSAPKGFVGRNICYAVAFDDGYFGAIVGGSTPKWLPGENRPALNNIVNNIFFHIEGPYPIRNFGQRVLALYRKQIELDWFLKYGDFVERHESLVELPRTGEVYRRDGWILQGQTKGQTCKRTAGKGTDTWTGKRVWDTENLRPKLVFARQPQ